MQSIRYYNSVVFLPFQSPIDDINKCEFLAFQSCLLLIHLISIRVDTCKVFITDSSQSQSDLASATCQIQNFALFIDVWVLFGKSFLEETLDIVLVWVVVLGSFLCVEFVDADFVCLSESALHFIWLIYKIKIKVNFLSNFFIWIHIFSSKHIQYTNYELEIHKVSLSILKPGPDVCLLGLDLHIFHQFQDLSLLFLLKPVFSPKTKE